MFSGFFTKKKSFSLVCLLAMLVATLILASCKSEDQSPPLRVVGIVAEDPQYEGDFGDTEKINFSFYLNRSVNAGEVVSFEYSTIDGIGLNPATTDDGDYISDSNTLIFSVGEIEKLIPVTIVGDSEIEEDESFFLEITNLSMNNIVSIKKYRAIATIKDDDRLPAVIPTYRGSTSEGDSGSTNGVLELSLDRAILSGTTASVDYRTVAITSTLAATEGSDYTAGSGTLSFTADEETAQIIIPILGDAVIEPDEIFEIILENPVGLFLGDDGTTSSISLQYIIKDDDGPDEDSDEVAIDLDVDDDNDGLIEIDFSNELYNMRFDSTGSSYSKSIEETLNGLGSDLGCPTEGCKGYELVNDIDLTGLKWETIAQLSGDFEGNNKTISNIEILSNTTSVGFFQNITGNVSNLNIDSIVIEPSSETGVSTELVGGLVGNAVGSTIENVTVTNALISGLGVQDQLAPIGGVVGVLLGGTISGSSFDGSIIGGVANSTIDTQLSVGGIVGVLYISSITDCISSGTYSGHRNLIIGGIAGTLTGATTTTRNASSAALNASGSLRNAIGGIVGQANDGVVTENSYSGTITANYQQGFLGGIIGASSAKTVSDNKSTATINGGPGADFIGGLIGISAFNQLVARQNIRNNTTLVVINGGAGDDFIGGLIGVNIVGIAENNYASVEIKGATGSDIIGGLVGRNSRTIVNSYAVGTIRGDANGDILGGLVGENFVFSNLTQMVTPGSISNSYATTNVIDAGVNVVGLLVGNNTYDDQSNTFISGSVSDSYYSTSSSISGGEGGIAFVIGTGKTLEQLKSLTNITPIDETTCTNASGTWSGTTCVGGSYDGWSTDNWNFGGQNGDGVGDVAILPTLKYYDGGTILCDQPGQPTERLQCPTT